MTTNVDKAEALLATNPAEALDALLAAWRTSFDPSVGRLIETLGASLAVPLEGLPVKKGERGDALARLAVRVPAEQRSAVLQAFEGFAREAAGRTVWPSVEAWAEAPLDPRVARMALRVLAQSKAQLTAKLWRRLVNCVERHADEGVVQDARDYEAQLKSQGGGWGFSPERFSNALKKVLKQRPCRAPEDAQTLARLSQALSRVAPDAPRAPEDDSALVEAIAARPADDGPRLVYADWLTERRHPRGEFIVLQVQRAQGRLSKQARAREAELLASHKSAFLGPFEDVAQKSSVRFERGFVTALRLSKPLPVHPLTRVLERVEFRYHPVPPEVRLDGLRAAVGPASARDWPRLQAAAPGLVDWEVSASGDWPAALTVVAGWRLERLALKALKGLRVDDALAQLFRNPGLSSTVRVLEVSFVGDCAGGPALATAPATLQRLVVDVHPLHADFTRTAEGWGLDLRLPYFSTPRSVAPALKGLLADFRAAPLQRLTVWLPGGAARAQDEYRGVVQALGPIAREVEWRVGRG